jgi:hypothetical protein
LQGRLKIAIAVGQVRAVAPRTCFKWYQMSVRVRLRCAQEYAASSALDQELSRGVADNARAAQRAYVLKQKLAVRRCPPASALLGVRASPDCAPCTSTVFRLCAWTNCA